MPRDVDEELVASVVRALRAYHSRATELDQQIAGRVGLSVTDMRCLDALDLAGGRMTAGDLARATFLTTGAVTGVLDRLERAGLARRVADENDRRKVVVELDADSRARGRAVYASIVDAERGHLHALDAGQLAALRAFLEAEAQWVGRRAADLRATGRSEPAP